MFYFYLNVSLIVYCDCYWGFSTEGQLFQVKKKKEIGSVGGGGGARDQKFPSVWWGTRIESV